MKKILLTSLAIAVSMTAGQAAFAANSNGKALSKQDILSASQGYILTAAKRPQSRRSALFAQIKESMAKRATLAKAGPASANKGWLVLK